MTNAGATFLFTMNESARDMLSIAARRSVAISRHEFHPADSLRLIRWLRPRRADSRLRTTSSYVALHPAQPRDSSRLTKYDSARVIASS